ncbi:MAG: nicotinamide mononucleotide transporter [Clostridia bacterium]|nr:nicotinamide mononucleotide transporter [Clostridia bacterium]
MKNIKNMSNIWLALAPLIITVLSIFAKSAILEVVSSIAGVIYVILIARQNKYGYIFGVINVILYAILSWNEGLYGIAVINTAYSIPILIYGFIYWSKDKEGKIEKLEKDNRIKVVACSFLMITIYAVISKTLFNNSNVIVDGIVTCIGLVGNILMAKKYYEQWYCWIVVNSTSLIYWGITVLNDLSCVPVVAMWLIYLANTLYGLFSWKKYYYKTHN